MKTVPTLVVPLAVLTFALAAFPAPLAAGPTAAEAFEQLKSLEGRWRTTEPGERPVSLAIQVIAGGHAVLEEFRMGEKGEISMYTVYHLDGERLMLTHYCVSNNQPRMVADLAGGEPGVLRFEFLDATNLADPNAGYMHRAVIRKLGDGRMANAWTYHKDGKEAFTESHEWQRVE